MGLIDVWHKTTGKKYRLGEQFVAQHQDTYTTEKPAEKPSGRRAAPEPEPDEGSVTVVDAPAAAAPEPAAAAEPAPVEQPAS